MQHDMYADIVTYTHYIRRCYLQVVAIKGEPFLSGMHPSAACLCKTLAQQDLRLREVLSPRSDFSCTSIQGHKQCSA